MIIKVNIMHQVLFVQMALLNFLQEIVGVSFGL